MPSPARARKSRIALAARRVWLRARRRPHAALLGAAAVIVSALVIGLPLAQVTYPPMTDLPFHAAQSAVFRHYWDPSYHFQEQFELEPLAVPYMSMYAVGALAMLVLPAASAVKVSAFAMLALLPAGLAVMFHGMKKSPLLGLSALPFCWCTLSHWGFLNHMGALGLFAMIVGLTLLSVDRPTPGRRIGLALALVALFFTHIFRFPFGVAAVLGTAIVMAPATRRLSPVLLPLAPGLALFALWLALRPSALGAEMDPLEVDTARLGQIPELLFSGFSDPRERAIAGRFLGVLALFALGALLARVLEPARPEEAPSEILFRRLALVPPFACAAVFLGMFLILPMRIGIWWYVYPREATAAALLALGVLPDLPRAALPRALFAALLALPGVELGGLVAKHYADFEAKTRDFRAIVRHLPRAPKLLYLIFDHRGTARSTSPFMHLPAWIQAERGGWLSFHFAVWGASPVAYRDRSEPGAVVPPRMPPRFEWTPYKFQIGEHAPFFDWFLVRNAASPHRIFEADPTIVPVAHEGTFWLYARKRAAHEREGAPRGASE